MKRKFVFFTVLMLVLLVGLGWALIVNKEAVPEKTSSIVNEVPESESDITETSVDVSEETQETEGETEIKDSSTSLLEQKVDSLQGAWKRTTPIGEGEHHETHDVRYIFLKKIDYNTSFEWRFTFQTRNNLSTIDSFLDESKLDLINNFTVATKEQSEVLENGEFSNGFIITENSADSITIQHLNPSYTEIVSEEFERISRNEVEEEFLGVYDVLIGE